jgi:type IV secretion system protein VirB10
MMIRFASKKSSLLLAAILFAKLASAQAVPSFDDSPAWSSPATSAPQDETQLRETMAPQVATTTDPSTVTIPAGTRVLMVLKSPLHTTSGTAGSGLYLETLYPIVQGNRVVIPAHTQVQGVVEANKRPGHVNRVSEFRFRFTTLIFPNNFVAPINGVLQSIPGAKSIRTRDKEGTLKPVDQTEKVVTPAAAGAVGGAIIGAHRGYGIGLLPGAGLGAALGLGAVLLKRGDAISLARGTNVEMILQAPLALEQAQVAENARYQSQPRPFMAPQQTCSAANAANNVAYQRKRCNVTDLSRLPLSD